MHMWYQLFSSTSKLKAYFGVKNVGEDIGNEQCANHFSCVSRCMFSIPETYWVRITSDWKRLINVVIYSDTCHGIFESEAYLSRLSDSIYTSMSLHRKFGSSSEDRGGSCEVNN